ncbi:MAG: L-serine ammonia-lyase [Acidobacteriota bacterium]
MRAAHRFAGRLVESDLLDCVERIEVHLFGSLSLTGRGHGTDRAVILGLEGETPQEVDVDFAPVRIAAIREQRRIVLLGRREVPFDPDRDIVWHRGRLERHPNGMRFVAFGADGQELLAREYYSVGGGFIEEEGVGGVEARPPVSALPYPVRTGAELLARAAATGLSVSELTLANEEVWRPRRETYRELLRIWSVMEACIERGCRREGVLPGGLGVTRRAPRIYRRLHERRGTGADDPLEALDWLSLWALAVAEENAAGGRIVTAPTNGAAGIVPAVLQYVRRFHRDDEETVVRFLATAGAIGLLYKYNASLSGAEVGCQGEVGVACSMAAAALTEVLGGTVPQVENAAEIGMEHHLGLTCDPVGGLVQIPCIERNAVAAVKAVEAAHLALVGDGSHRVSLDKVIETMWRTGLDMSRKYKETAKGGLAVSLAEC